MIQDIIKSNSFRCLRWKVRGTVENEEDEYDIAGVAEAGGASGEISMWYVQA